MLRKQEKMEKIISQLSLQVKDMSEKLDNFEGKKKLEWWEVCIIFIKLSIKFFKLNINFIYLFILELCGRWG